VLPRAIAGRQIFPPAPHYLSQQRDNDDTRSSSSPHHRRRRSRAALNRSSAVPVAATGRRILGSCLNQEQLESLLPSPSLVRFNLSYTRRTGPDTKAVRRLNPCRSFAALSLTRTPCPTPSLHRDGGANEAIVAAVARKQCLRVATYFTTSVLAVCSGTLAHPRLRGKCSLCCSLT
jgi:hypothetical protein